MCGLYIEQWHTLRIVYVGCTDSSSRSSIYTILKVCHHSIYKPHIPWCYVGCTDSLSRSSIYTILKVCHRSIYKPHIPSCYVGFTDSSSRSSIYIQFSRYVTVLYINHTYHHIKWVCTAYVTSWYVWFIYRMVTYLENCIYRTSRWWVCTAYVTWRYVWFIYRTVTYLENCIYRTSRWWVCQLSFSLQGQRHFSINRYRVLLLWQTT
jgi:hypothetical protein